jgi:hypothetical protein
MPPRAEFETSGASSIGPSIDFDDPIRLYTKTRRVGLKPAARACAASLRDELYIDELAR